MNNHTLKVYTPKGSMCISCKKWNEDCSHLKFDTMPVIERNVKDDRIIIVKCTSYEKRNE